MNVLKKLKIMDWALCVLGIAFVFRVDFSNVVLEEVIFLSAFGLWFVMLLVRLFIQIKREKGEW